jgi:hypothetical protein
MEKYDLVAPCGDYCGGCGQYNGLIIETAIQMREFTDLYGFEFRSEGAFDFKQFVRGLEWFIDNARCPGCRQGGGPPGCEVRKCSVEKELRICSECEEFPCSEIKEYADPDTMDRYKRFKEIGFKKWLDEQAQKAKEGYEIHLQKVASLKP